MNNTNTEKMTINELFLIKSALHLLAEKNQLEGDIFGDFNAIADLEKTFSIAYYLAKESN